MQTETNFVQHEKFTLIQQISQILRDAPPPVRRAWQEGWTDIEHIPFLGAWFGEHLVEIKLGNHRILLSLRHWICGENGENPYYMKETSEKNPKTNSCDFEIGTSTIKFRIG